jgi:thymidylate synthase (FAD)
MTGITMLTDVDVQLVESMASDKAVADAARVSVIGDKTLTREVDTAADTGLIGYLMKNRHGTPFEHNAFKFYVKAPIFVFREFHRHRVGFSYNEMSGRYTELPGEFYIPAEDRPLVQTGKPGAYEFIAGSHDQHLTMRWSMYRAYEVSWSVYQDLMAQGVAKEVARMVLPVGIFSQMYVTCNARSLMSFLSLRTKDASSLFPSYPQQEIEMVARRMEDALAEAMPITHRHFQKNGRVAP